MTRTVSPPILEKLPDLQSGQSAREILAPGWRELTILSLATLVAATFYAYSSNISEGANFIAPILLGIALIEGALRMMRTAVATIWTPVFWIRIALIAYIAVGSIVPYFINEETSELINSFYTFYPQDVAKYNLVNCLFVLIFIYLFRFFSNFLFGSEKIQKQLSFEPSIIGVAPFGAMLLSIGILLFLTISLPFQLGLFEGTFPTFLNELAYAGPIGIFLLSYWSFSNGYKSMLWITASLLFYVFFGLLIFNKSFMLMPIIMFFMGYIYSKPDFRRVVIGVSIILPIYFVTAPLVSYGRNTIAEGSAADVQSSIAERINAIQSYIGGDRTSESEEQLQTGWARLSYVNGGTFAISQYDADQPGHSMDYLPIIWIPRFLYPSKPIITDVARDFNYAATGNRESSSTPGMPSEAYWDYGWAGLPIFGVLIAFIFAFWSHYTIAVVRSGAWHLFFIVLMGMRVGTRVDGMLVSDIFGPVGFAVLGHIVLQFLNRLLVGKKPVVALTRASA